MSHGSGLWMLQDSPEGWGRPGTFARLAYKTAPAFVQKGIEHLVDRHREREQARAWAAAQDQQASDNEAWDQAQNKNHALRHALAQQQELPATLGADDGGGHHAAGGDVDWGPEDEAEWELDERPLIQKLYDRHVRGLSDHPDYPLRHLPLHPAIAQQIAEQWLEQAMHRGTDPAEALHHYRVNTIGQGLKPNPDVEDELKNAHHQMLFLSAMMGAAPRGEVPDYIMSVTARFHRLLCRASPCRAARKANWRWTALSTRAELRRHRRKRKLELRNWSMGGMAVSNRRSRHPGNSRCHHSHCNARIQSACAAPPPESRVSITATDISLAVWSRRWRTKVSLRSRAGCNSRLSKPLAGTAGAMTMTTRIEKQAGPLMLRLRV
jgi:hypothetical protein